MSRPTRIPIVAGAASWDADLEDNLVALFDGPLPIAVHSVNESDLQSVFPAASFADCLIWVPHTVLGKTLYYSNGTAWSIYRIKPYVRTVASSVGTLAVAAYDDVIVISGTSAIAVALPPVISNVGRTLTFRKSGASGTITIDGNASERINGNLSVTLTALDQVLRIVSDGVDWHQL